MLYGLKHAAAPTVGSSTIYSRPRSHKPQRRNQHNIRTLEGQPALLLATLAMHTVNTTVKLCLGGLSHKRVTCIRIRSLGHRLFGKPIPRLNPSQNPGGHHSHE